MNANIHVRHHNKIETCPTNIHLTRFQPFFSIIYEKAQISILKFLQEALMCEGFDDHGSFRQIKADSAAVFFAQIEVQVSENEIY
jgi:heat shock protein HspQ